MMANKRLLLVEDDRALADLVTFHFERSGYDVSRTGDGEEALILVDEVKPDVILLDWMIEGISGIEVCRRLRRRATTANVPIMMLTARGEEGDRIRGFETGADDYVTKPFSPRELVARVQTILKRTSLRQTSVDEIKELAHGALRVDLYGHGAFWKDKRVALTATEFAILQTLLREPQRVFSRDRLMDAAYQGQVTVTDRTIDSHMRNLRAKYAKAGCKDLVETVHGVGYKLGPCR